MLTCALPPKLLKEDKYVPLGYSKYWDIIEWNRKTQEGIKMTYVARGSCENCRLFRTLPTLMSKVATDLRTAREQNADPKHIQHLEKKLKTLETKWDFVKEHAEWYQQNRPWIDDITGKLKRGELPNTQQIIFDFGKIYASDSEKAKILICSIFSNSPPEAYGHSVLEHLDNWFRGSSCGLVTVRILEFHMSQGIHFRPGLKNFWHSDTGNGNRGWELLGFLSTCKSRFNIENEWSSFCPGHAAGPADWQIGHVSQKAHAIKRNSRILELDEFAEISSQLPNTFPYVHEDKKAKHGIDDPDTIFCDSEVHWPIFEPRKVKGIRRIARAQFVWPAKDGKVFYLDYFCRVSAHVTGDDWIYWDLKPDRPPFCNICIHEEMRPVWHDDPDHHPLPQRQHHATARGIQV